MGWHQKCDDHFLVFFSTCLVYVWCFTKEYFFEKWGTTIFLVCLVRYSIFGVKIVVHMLAGPRKTTKILALKTSQIHILLYILEKWRPTHFLDTILYSPKLQACPNPSIHTYPKTAIPATCTCAYNSVGRWGWGSERDYGVEMVGCGYIWTKKHLDGSECVLSAAVSLCGHYKYDIISLLCIQRTLNSH